jgi:hypothetical protein
LLDVRARTTVSRRATPEEVENAESLLRDYVMGIGVLRHVVISGFDFLAFNK